MPDNPTITNVGMHLKLQNPKTLETQYPPSALTEDAHNGTKNDKKENKQLNSQSMEHGTFTQNLQIRTHNIHSKDVA